MFSNADFANMVRGSGGGGGGNSGGGGGGKGGGEKARFDLKQIKQWDNQNKQEYVNKQARGGGGGGGSGAGGGGGKKRKEDNNDDIIPKEKVTRKSALEAAGYRDRALERRKEENREFHEKNMNQQQRDKDSIHQPPPSTSSNVFDSLQQSEEDIIANLDIEQTKYLGGDMEHTHLVKGLDYALLAKTRQQLEKEGMDEQKKSKKSNKNKPSTIAKKKVMNIFGDEDEEDEEESGDDESGSEGEDGGGKKPLTTSTTLGASLKRLMFNVHDDSYQFRNLSIDIELNTEEFLLAQEQQRIREESIANAAMEASSSGGNSAVVNKLLNLQKSYGVGLGTSGTAGGNLVVTASVQSGLDARKRLLSNSATKAGDILARTTYSFDVKPTSEIDVPLTVVRSKKGSNTGEDYVNYQLSKDLAEKIKELFVDGEGKLLPQSKRKPKVVAAAPAPIPSKTALPPGVPGRIVASSSASAMPAIAPTAFAAKPVSDSIYDDDDLEEPAVPVAATIPSAVIVDGPKPIISKKRSIEGLNTIVIFSDDDEDEPDFITREKLQKPQSNSTANCGNDNSSGALKGLFRNIKSTAVQINKSSSTAPVSSSSSSTAPSSSTTTVDVLQPVREMLIAKAAKERMQKQQLVNASTTTSKEIKFDLVDSQGKGLIHRDVFASTKDKVVNADETLGQKRGDTFGISGAYDVYPETGEYDIFSDDEDGDGVKQQTLNRKRARLEEGGDSAGGGGSKNYSGMGGKTPGYRKK